MGSSWARDYNCQEDFKDWDDSDYKDDYRGGGSGCSGKKNITNEEWLESTRKKARVIKNPSLYRIVKGKRVL